MPNHVTVASRSTEIWPFEFLEISTFSVVRHVTKSAPVGFLC